jgi:hypothetical protein
VHEGWGVGGVAALGRCLRNHTIAAGGLGEVAPDPPAQSRRLRHGRPVGQGKSNRCGYADNLLATGLYRTTLICCRRRSANKNALPRPVSRSNNTTPRPKTRDLVDGPDFGLDE